MRVSNWIMKPQGSGWTKTYLKPPPSWLFCLQYTEITIHWQILAEKKIGFCWCFFSAQTIHITSWLKVKIRNLRWHKLAQSHLSYVWAVAAAAIYRGANFLGPIILIHSHTNDLSLAPVWSKWILRGSNCAWQHAINMHQQCSSVKRKEVKLNKLSWVDTLPATNIAPENRPPQ